MGAANAEAAADVLIAIARRLRVPLKVAVVHGEDVLDRIDLDSPTMETGKPIAEAGPLASATAYLGADALLAALGSNADVIISGRVADPSLFLGPMVHHYGWALDDFDPLARGTAVGHLLECVGQLCGGYFAEPGRKDVPAWRIWDFPLPMSMPKATPCWARSAAPAAASNWQRRRNSCSTK